MLKLLTLMEIEIKKLLPVLIIIFSFMTVVSSAVFYRASHTLNMKVMKNLAGNSVAEYVAETGGVTILQAINLSYNNLFLLFGFIAFVLVVISSFYLWYKEWFGQSKRIYLLFSLRGSRFTILLAKLLTVIGATFIFYGMILINLLIGWVILTFVLPDGIMATDPLGSVISQATKGGLGFSFPLSFIDFIYKIFLVTVAFSGISVWVFSDRSKKIWGFILGGAYCIALASIYIGTQSMFLFFDERALIDWGFALGASALSLIISYALLNKTVSI